MRLSHHLIRRESDDTIRHRRVANVSFSTIEKKTHGRYDLFIAGSSIGRQHTTVLREVPLAIRYGEEYEENID